MRGSRYALVIADLHRTAMTEHALVRAVRQAASDTFILFTSMVDRDLVHHMPSIGSIDYVRKPLSIRTIWSPRCGAFSVSMAQERRNPDMTHQTGIKP